MRCMHHHPGGGGACSAQCRSGRVQPWSQTTDCDRYVRIQHTRSQRLCTTQRLSLTMGPGEPLGPEEPSFPGGPCVETTYNHIGDSAICQSGDFMLLRFMHVEGAPSLFLLTQLRTCSATLQQDFCKCHVPYTLSNRCVHYAGPVVEPYPCSAWSNGAQRTARPWRTLGKEQTHLIKC